MISWFLEGTVYASGGGKDFKFDHDRCLIHFYVCVYECPGGDVMSEVACRCQPRNSRVRVQLMYSGTFPENQAM